MGKNPPARAALDEILRGGLDAGSLLALSDDQLIALTRAAEEVGRLADAARVLTAGELSRRSRPSLGADRLCAERGCRTPAELLQRITHVSSRTARERLRSATPLQTETSLSGQILAGPFALTRRALAAGILNVDAARTVTNALGPALSHGADPADVQAAEANLVTTATGIPFADEDKNDDESPNALDGLPSDSPSRPMGADEVATMAKVWELALDPDGALPDEDQGMRHRGLTLGRAHRGTVTLRGALLPEVAAQLQLLIDSVLNPRRPAPPEPPTGTPDTGTDPDTVPGTDPDTNPDTNSGTDAARDADPTHGDDPRWDTDLRSAPQRRHDAFAAILGVAAAHTTTPSLGGSAPTLVVSVTPDQLADPHGVAFLDGQPDADRAVVPSSVARHIACSGAIQRVAAEPTGRLITMDTPNRVFTAHQRRAITLRDGGCVIPGCAVPASWCEIHHVTEHHSGGPTHTDNGVLLCWYHHRTLDTNGWQITMRDGLPQVTTPAWIDPRRTTRPALGSPHRQWDEHRQAPTLRPPRATRSSERASKTTRVPHNQSNTKPQSSHHHRDPGQLRQ